MRSCIVCGSFYESDKSKLRDQIKQCFLSIKGPGLPKNKSKNTILGCIVPHAGYFFSGACAAHAYKKIAESNISKKIILIGPNHHGFSSGISDEDWQTPLGIVKTDNKLVEKIAENTELEINNELHFKEHSIEVQLPFLQYVLDDFEICAITLGSDINLRKLGQDFSKIYDGELIIVSSDFTHFGFNYGYMPFARDIDKNLKNLNNEAIEKVLNNDVEGFLEYLKKTKNTICGRNGIVVFLNMIKNINTKNKLLCHYKSSDIIEDKMNSVSYVSILFEKN